jgi:hypothetical protein
MCTQWLTPFAPRLGDTRRGAAAVLRASNPEEFQHLVEVLCGSPPPGVNGRYWGPKLARNPERDRETDARLAEVGCAVARVWKHEDPEEAPRRVAEVVADRPRGRRG